MGSNVIDFGHTYRKPGNPSPSLTGTDVVVTVTDGNNAYDVSTGTTQIALPDGNVQVLFGEQPDERQSDNFDDNLAEYLSDAELSALAEKLLLGIAQDEQTRDAWLQNMSNGISLLGLEMKSPRGAAATGASPTEGMSTVDHPLLLEAVLRFQANARGELLPTDGPVKVRNDGEETNWSEELADALQKDLNHYLTKTASEYYPDTDRMLFLLGFSGIAFKKGYHDPIKRRPVIASIDAKDLIVSNAATNLEGAGRVTHRIMMRPSLLKRMQLVGAYRNVHLAAPGMPALKNPVDQKIDQVQGVAPATYVEPADQDRELYECYCETEIPGFEHEIDGEPSGLPLPYKVTLDRESRKVLEVRRNWDENDEMCLPKNRIIAYIFVPGMGFYGIGLLNILGNSAKAVTAAWRLMIDAGMFANFPGFLYLKSLAKQLTNQFRIAPGSGMPIDTVGNDIRASVMPLPYKDPSAVFIQLIDNIATTAQRVGGTAELQIGEGKQDAPVGTTLALIEQATKVMSAVHKRLHQAQSQELAMLRDLLMEDPSALWRHRKKKSKLLKFFTQQLGQQSVAMALEQSEERHEALFVAALNDCELVPAADPNTSSQTERYLKITALKQLQATNPNLDGNEIDRRALHTLGFDDAEALFKPPPAPGSPPPLPSPEEMTAQATLTAANARVIEANAKAQSAQADATARTAEIQSRERIAGLQVEREQIIHESEQRAAAGEKMADIGHEAQQRSLDRAHAFAMQHHKLTHASTEAGLGRQHEAVKTGVGLAHKSYESDVERAHKAQEAGLGRTHEAFKAMGGFVHEAHQSGLDRAHEHVQSGFDRAHEAATTLVEHAHEAEQAAAEREHQAKQAKLKPAAPAKPKPKGK